MARKVKKVEPAPSTESELVVMANQNVMLRAAPSRMESMAGASVSSAEKALKKYNAVMKPMFGSSEERVVETMRMGSATASAPLTDLSVFYRVEAPEDKKEDLRKELEADPLFEAAYIKPPVGMPEEAGTEINAMTPISAAAPSSTQDFTNRQIYLNASPEGVDARWAWTQAGGRGDDIRIIDIEGNWVFTHEDLIERQGGVLGGTVHNGVSWRNHGTAVLGEYGGDVNGFGVTGICSDAITSAVSHGTIGSAGAINHAASRLRAGDIMLLEMHRPGPRHNFAWRGDQKGYIAVEWWPDDYAAILNATRQGIIVVEAAGNGAEDLDDAIYETRPVGFPASWTNPFRRSNRDSGAIVVGAGAPPPGTHGANHGADRSRLGFSNYGALIDAQGWGREVTTCGYGDLQGGPSEDLWYTDRFSGTSSASPIVVGAIGCIQGMAKARGRAVFTPTEIRDVLRTTGAPQQDTPGRPKTQRIGNRPDIPAMARKVFGGSTGTVCKIAFRRSIDRCRPLEIRALLDGSPEIACFYDPTTLQGGLISAQSLRQSDSGNLDDMAILFRFSDVQGQSVDIMGAVGGGRYAWLGWIAADGLGQVSFDQGFSTSGSDYFDLLADIQGSELRMVFNDATQLYEPAGGAPLNLLRSK